MVIDLDVNGKHTRDFLLVINHAASFLRFDTIPAYDGRTEVEVEECVSRSYFFKL